MISNLGIDDQIMQENFENRTEVGLFGKYTIRKYTYLWWFIPKNFNECYAQHVVNTVVFLKLYSLVQFYYLSTTDVLSCITLSWAVLCHGWEELSSIPDPCPLDDTQQALYQHYVSPKYLQTFLVSGGKWQGQAKLTCRWEPVI